MVLAGPGSFQRPAAALDPPGQPGRPTPRLAPSPGVACQPLLLMMAATTSHPAEDHIPRYFSFSLSIRQQNLCSECTIHGCNIDAFLCLGKALPAYLDHKVPSALALVNQQGAWEDIRRVSIPLFPGAAGIMQLCRLFAAFLGLAACMAHAAEPYHSAQWKHLPDRAHIRKNCEGLKRSEDQSTHCMLSNTSRYIRC